MKCEGCGKEIESGMWCDMKCYEKKMEAENAKKS